MLYGHVAAGISLPVPGPGALIWAWRQARVLNEDGPGEEEVNPENIIWLKWVVLVGLKKAAVTWKNNVDSECVMFKFVLKDTVWVE